LLIFNLLINIALETTQVFVPLYAQNLGASKLIIGVTVAVYFLAYFASSIISGRQSDLHGRLIFLRTGLILIIGSYLLPIFVRTPLNFLLVRALHGACLGTITATVTAYTYDHQKQIGNFAAYGSLGWLVGALIAVAINSYQALFITSSVATLFALLITLSFTERPEDRLLRAPLPLSLLRDNLKVYLSVFIRQLGASASFSVLPLLMVSLGASRTFIALMDVANTATQFISMRLVERFNPVRVFRLGLLSTMVVFAAYGLLPNYRLVLLVQILLGIAWSCLYMGALVYLLKTSKERGSTTGLFLASMSLANGIGPRSEERRVGKECTG
jgi:MFS family permease